MLLSFSWGGVEGTFVPAIGLVLRRGSGEVLHLPLALFCLKGPASSCYRTLSTLPWAAALKAWDKYLSNLYPVSKISIQTSHPQCNTAEFLRTGLWTSLAFPFQICHRALQFQEKAPRRAFAFSLRRKGPPHPACICSHHLNTLLFVWNSLHPIGPLFCHPYNGR